MVVSSNTNQRRGSTQPALERVSPHVASYLARLDMQVFTSWKSAARMTMGGLVPALHLPTSLAPSSPRVVADFFFGVSRGIDKSFDRWRLRITGQIYLSMARTLVPPAPWAAPIPRTLLVTRPGGPCFEALTSQLLEDVRKAPRTGIVPEDWDAATRLIAAQVGASFVARLSILAIDGAKLAANRNSFTDGRLS